MLSLDIIIHNKCISSELWFYWPLLGWEIELFFHEMGVIVFPKFPGKQWEEQKIKEVM